MQNNVLDIDFVSESAFGGEITEGFSLPDLTLSPQQKNIIKSELLDFKDDEINETQLFRL